MYQAVVWYAKAADSTRPELQRTETKHLNGSEIMMAREGRRTAIGLGLTIFIVLLSSIARSQEPVGKQAAPTAVQIGPEKIET
jgi:hypothetical protein